MIGHEADIRAILNRRHGGGADYWATDDGRIYVGNPYSTLSSLAMLHELGVRADHEAVAGGLALVLDACRPDGRIRVGPGAPMYPCYTAEAARVLCRFGYSDDARVLHTVSYLVDNAHASGGWRCDYRRFGRGPETEFANPGATLYVLDVLRFFPTDRDARGVIDAAVDSLLRHWEVRVPTGPCHRGIGSRSQRVEFPFLRYNLFYYVYVLSFYERARRDDRFGAALDALDAKLDQAGRVVVESRHRGLSGLRFCATGRPSDLATRRYGEIRQNLEAQGAG